ncbi:hypothetical protein HZS_5637 [Henneguya salminicola]|nr:hypothetical protein HZS_5637 [Henneguya salminicola]
MIKFHLNKRIIFKFHGYTNLANNGPFYGCCGEKWENICLPCQYIIIIHLHN